MKKILSLLLTVCIMFSMLSMLFAFPAAAKSHIGKNNFDGLSFDCTIVGSKAFGAEYYESVKRLEEVPRSFEAWVYLSSSMIGSNMGTVIGNYGKGGGSFALSITKKFRPEIRFYNSSAAASSPTHLFEFTEAQIRGGEWTHVVVTVDEIKGELKCYLNGELKQTAAITDSCKSSACAGGCSGVFKHQWAGKYPIHLGGIDEPMNKMYFRGNLQDTALYSDVLTADEVRGNYQNGVNVNDKNLICYYDLDSSDKGQNIKDSSGNGYDIYYSKLWLTEEEMAELRKEKGYADSYAYSIAVLGDIQYMTKSNPDELRTMFEWIVAHKDEKDIRYSIGLGDITDQCQESEWLTVKDIYKIFEDAGLEYSLVRGNHDVATVSGIEEASKATAVPEMYDELFFNNVFYRSQFDNYGGFYEEGSVKNTYRTLKLNNDNWLIVNLDFHADSDVRAWANEVIAAHPDNRVIIVTHEYITSHGKPSTYGKTLWSEVVSKHKNVELVLGGHVTYDNINVFQCKGENGNTVTQMLIDPQYMDREMKGLGVVTMFYFREDGKVIDIEHYSTVKDRYLMNINQLVVDLRAECDYYDMGFDGVTAIAPLGEGTKENPYKISRAENLLWMAKELYEIKDGNIAIPTALINKFEGKYFVQTRDINMNGVSFYPIGYYYKNGVGSVFGGSYDGAGYSIINANIVNPIGEGAAGLFGETLGATIKNLTLKYISVSAAEKNGVLIGGATDTTIENCEISQSCNVLFTNTNVYGMVGGAIGEMVGGITIGTISEARLLVGNAAATVGGICGVSRNEATIYASEFAGEIILSGESGASKTADIVGEIIDNTTLVRVRAGASPYNLAPGAKAHTADSFKKNNDGTHTGVCTCGCKAEITLAHIKGADGYCTLCEAAITGASVSLDKDISLKYYVELFDEGIKGDLPLVMEFTMNGTSVRVDKYSRNDGRYVFTLDGILPQMMGDIIDARLILGEGDSAVVLAEKNGYSIREYCEALLVLPEISEELCELVDALFTYSTEAQRYLGYRNDAFVSGGMVLSEREELPGEEEKRSITNNKNSDFKVASNPKVSFDGRLKIELKLKITDLALAEITVNGEKYDVNNLISLGDSKYSLEITDISCTEINEELEIVLYYNGVEGAKVICGADSHLYGMIEDKQQIAEDLANYQKPSKTVDEAEFSFYAAMHRYGISAVKYHESVKEA